MPDSNEPTNALLAALLQAQQTIALQAQTIHRLTALLETDDGEQHEDQPSGGYLNSRG